MTTAERFTYTTTTVFPAEPDLQAARRFAEVVGSILAAHLRARDPNAAMIHRDGPAQPKPAAIQAPLLIDSRPDTAGLMVVAALGQRW